MTRITSYATIHFTSTSSHPRRYVSEILDASLMLELNVGIDVMVQLSILTRLTTLLVALKVIVNSARFIVEDELQCGLIAYVTCGAQKK